MSENQGVFIIYGRDQTPMLRLKEMLRTMDLPSRTFLDVANSMHANSYVGDIVHQGIEQSSYVIALFTPDELTAYYEVSTRRLSDENGASRWQARPNVIFEAGLAMGKLGANRCILCTVGADVRLFSDVDGKHFIDLTRDEGPARLLSALKINFPNTLRNAVLPVGMTFADCIRRGWVHYDEIEVLMGALSVAMPTGNLSDSPLDLLRRWVDGIGSDMIRNIRSRPLMQQISKRFGPKEAEACFWPMLQFGFFQLNQIGFMFSGDGAKWPEWIDQLDVSPRGRSLLQRLEAVRSPV